MTSDTTLEIPVTRDVFGFTDRPSREYAYLTAFEFASFWREEGANSFSEDPPNAVLTWLHGEEQREAEVIINNATVYSDGAQESLVYTVTLETEKMPDAQMSFVSLFVDSNTDCSEANWKPQAYLVECDLTNAKLDGADLQWANLTGAILTNADLTYAIFKGTRCPDGSSSDSNNHCGCFLEVCVR